MTILRVFKCDGCGFKEMETKPNEGSPDWIKIQGVVLNKVEDPLFCKECAYKIMQFVDSEVTN